MKKRKKGFTLIELIIVVAIIGILAAIAVPKFSDVQKKAKINADVASAKVIADALNLAYAQDELAGIEATDKLTKVTSSIGVQNVPEVQGKYTGITADDFYYTLDGSGNVKVYVGPDTGAKLGSDSNVEEVYPNNN